MTKLAGAPPAVTCAAFVYDAGLAQRAYVFARTWLQNHFLLAHLRCLHRDGGDRAGNHDCRFTERIQIAYLSTLAGHDLRIAVRKPALIE
nr:Uncharacterised protein [Klebsiella pneumoniae]